jgi:DNA polymerase-1
VPKHLQAFFRDLETKIDLLFSLLSPGKILWVDNYGDADGVLEEFRDFLASEEHKKVWHNYGFDRHVLYNAPDGRMEQRLDCRGFGGDTMHMARLWDTSMERSAGEGGFSLQALSSLLLGEAHRKESMKELFGQPKLRKDGTPGSVLIIPPVEELQTSIQYRAKWIKYSSYDAQATWLVHKELMKKLDKLSWKQKDGTSMMDYYNRYLIPFGHLLTDMEREGIYVECEGYLKGVEMQAKEVSCESEYKGNI